MFEYLESRDYKYIELRSIIFKALDHPIRELRVERLFFSLKEKNSW